LKLLTKIKLILILLIFVGGNAIAQQLPHYSHYMINNYVLNPAVGGVDPYFQAMSTSRYQWVGLTDAPRTYILSVNGPTKSLKVGLGGLIFTDIVGPTRRTGASLSYAYHMMVSKKTKLSLGLSAGLLQFSVDGSKIQLRDPADLVSSNSVQTVFKPDFGVGLHWYSIKKTWYIGASVPQILQNQVDFYKISNSPASNLARHYFVTSGYRFLVGKNYIFEPSVLLKYAHPTPLQFDAGFRFLYQNKIWAGAVYRSDDAIATLVGFNVGSVTIAYAYDFTTSNLRNYSSGTHELMIGVSFHKVKIQRESGY
jgi:type IX secretion system PorP/SprF family membrane protein